MGKVTRDQVRQIAGALSEEKIATIIGIGETVEEIEEALTLAEGKSDLTGMGESALRGRVVEILTIMTSTAA